VTTRPLEGVRVLDLTRLLPGPFASLVLADLGASVDKVEDTGKGDYLRLTPPYVGGSAAARTGTAAPPTSAAARTGTAAPQTSAAARTGTAAPQTSSTFLALNRGKRSVCLDLKMESARAALLKMVERYDVLFEQFRPGVLDRLGLGHATLRAANPRLVVCALTGYGQDGPLAGRAGHDINYLARSGVLGMQGPAGAAPQVPGFQLADIGGGLWSVIGILAALAERARTGQGSVVDVSMVEASMGFALAGFGQLFAGQSPERGNEPLTGGLALYGTYASKDGKFVSLGALEPKFWQVFCEAVGIEADARALWPGEHQTAIRERLRAVFASRTRDEWEAFGREHDCCLEPVLEPGELRTDEHLRARGMFFEIDSPWGRIEQLRTPLAPRGATCTPPPRQGEHTDLVLREAGIDEATIAAMRAERAAR
jgi:crotonobetainyl-CoA:carnitine CoA-transferase CaiB-like acyl-CoA transferase